MSIKNETEQEKIDRLTRKTIWRALYSPQLDSLARIELRIRRKQLMVAMEKYENWWKENKK